MIQSRIMQTVSPRYLLFLIGLHRSGTSALCAALHACGASFGQHLLEPMEQREAASILRSGFGSAPLEERDGSPLGYGKHFLYPIEKTLSQMADQLVFMGSEKLIFQRPVLAFMMRKLWEREVR